jgi:hypothetical protein
MLTKGLVHALIKPWRPFGLRSVGSETLTEQVGSNREPAQVSINKCPTAGFAILRRDIINLKPIQVNYDYLTG